MINSPAALRAKPFSPSHAKAGKTSEFEMEIESPKEHEKNVSGEHKYPSEAID